MKISVTVKLKKNRYTKKIHRWLENTETAFTKVQKRIQNPTKIKSIDKKSCWRSSAKKFLSNFKWHVAKKQSSSCSPTFEFTALTTHHHESDACRKAMKIVCVDEDEFCCLDDSICLIKILNTNNITRRENILEFAGTSLSSSFSFLSPSPRKDNFLLLSLRRSVRCSNRWNFERPLKSAKGKEGMDRFSGGWGNSFYPTSNSAYGSGVLSSMRKAEEKQGGPNFNPAATNYYFPQQSVITTSGGGQWQQPFPGAHGHVHAPNCPNFGTGAYTNTNTKYPSNPNYEISKAKILTWFLVSEMCWCNAFSFQATLEVDKGIKSLECHPDPMLSPRLTTLKSSKGKLPKLTWLNGMETRGRDRVSTAQPPVFLNQIMSLSLILEWPFPSKPILEQPRLEVVVKSDSLRCPHHLLEEWLPLR